MSKCNAFGCKTEENSEIDGKSLTLFSFPTYDDSLVKQWEENSKLSYTPEKNHVELKLCELHFESSSFASDERNALAPGAVPTIFEFNNKRKTVDENEEEKKEEKEPDDPQEPPIKQTKLQEDEDLPAAATPLQIPVIESEPKAVIDDQDNTKVENFPPSEIMEEVQKTLDKNDGSSIFTKQIDMGKKVYRLIIRIDKVIKSDDIPKESKSIIKESNVEVKVGKLSNLNVKNVSIIRPCSKTGCKLIKTTLNSKPVFRCERCSKYYIIKENKTELSSSWTCYICKEVLHSPESLGIHVREHLICDMCQAQCSTQLSYDKHVMLHVSTDPLLPYKCHKCPSNFEVKADVRQHYEDKHYKKNSKQSPMNNKKHINSTSQLLFRCEYCYAVFKKEQAYKSHVDLHMGDGHFDCALCSKKFKTAKHLATHQSRHLGSLKFTCQICSKEFPSIEAVDTHMKTHIEIMREEHKCNICKKKFKNESVLNTHMRGHLSRAHRCPSCSKAFINKTSLMIHFKTHGKAASTINTTSRDLVGKKRHTCTLCPSTFESRSRLYNHIMTHLEQMHGGEEGGDVVFDGLNELLESEEGVIS